MLCSEGNKVVLMLDRAMDLHNMKGTYSWTSTKYTIVFSFEVRKFKIKAANIL